MRAATRAATGGTFAGYWSIGFGIAIVRLVALRDGWVRLVRPDCVGLEKQVYYLLAYLLAYQQHKQVARSAVG